MPRLTYTYTDDAFNDGDGQFKSLMDLSEDLSKRYGRLIRQGQIFKIRSIEARLVNPSMLAEVFEDEVLACSGKFIFVEPTGNRKKAWVDAFKTVQQNRRALGHHRGKGYDFRVGLYTGYSTDVDTFGDGVKYNAWVNADDNLLMLHTDGSTDTATGTQSDSIFGVYNRQNLVSSTMLEPRNPSGGFGHWAAKDADASFDELDFVQNEYAFYTEGAADTTFQTAPFMLGFGAHKPSAVQIAAGTHQAYVGVSPVHRTEGPLNVMCGLIGVYIDTTTIDDTGSQNQHYSVEITVDVESWDPIMKKSKKGSK